MATVAKAAASKSRGRTRIAKTSTTADLPSDVPKTRFDDQSETGWIAVNNLVIDHRVQRDRVNRAKLKRMKARYRRRGLGTLIVSRRTNGENVIIDGQHRWLLVAELEGEDFELRCQIYTGLSLADEAELFILTNADQQPANALDLHKADVVREEPVAMRIEKAVLGQGWVIGSGKKAISAVQVLKDLYELGEKWSEGAGASVVEDTITVVTDAWGQDADMVVNHSILRAVGTFIVDVRRWVTENDRGVDFFDLEWLSNRMAKELKGGAKGWLDAMRPIANGGNWTLQQTLRNSLVTTYNTGRRSGKLPAALRPAP